MKLFQQNTLSLFRNKSSLCQQINVTFLGSRRAGKSSVIANMVGEKVTENYQPTFREVINHRTNIYNTLVDFEISEMSGEYIFQAIEREMIGHTNVIVIVFSLSDPKSFDRAFQIYERIKDCKKSPVVFVGNKTDLNRRCFPKEVIEQYTTSLNESFIEISAKTESAEVVLRRIYEEYECSRGPYKVTTVPMKIA